MIENARDIANRISTHVPLTCREITNIPSLTITPFNSSLITPSTPSGLCIPPTQIAVTVLSLSLSVPTSATNHSSFGAFVSFGGVNLWPKKKNVANAVPEEWRGSGCEAAVPDDDGVAGAPVGLHSEDILDTDSPIASHHSSRRCCRRCPANCGVLRHHRRRLGPLYRTHHYALHWYFPFTLHLYYSDLVFGKCYNTYPIWVLCVHTCLIALS